MNKQYNALELFVCIYYYSISFNCHNYFRLDYAD